MRLKKIAIAATLATASIAVFEGIRLEAYRDPVGIPTICFGETQNIKMGMRATLPECKNMLVTRSIQIATEISRCIDPNVIISNKTFASFISFSYNVGATAFCSSTLLKKLNAGDTIGACHELDRWIFAKKVVHQGLKNRRAEEKKMCLEGIA